MEARRTMAPKKEPSTEERIEQIVQAHAGRLANEISDVYDTDIQVTPKISGHLDEDSERWTLNIVFSVELDPDGYVERRFYRVTAEHYAVTDGEVWKTYPKKLCKGARIVTCVKCGKPAVIVDAMYPYFHDLNRCGEHTADVAPCREKTEAR
jgi:hypothetical protein